jgi:hypothetical protein
VPFPNTSRVDADHAWLTPVKAASDILAIETLVRQGVLNLEFVHDVLAVDLSNPLFSQGRCRLLRLVPQTPDWQAFFQALSEAGVGPHADPAAQELLHNLMDPSRHSQFHQARAKVCCGNAAPIYSLQTRCARCISSWPNAGSR